HGDTRYESRANGNISLRGINFRLHYDVQNSRPEALSIDLVPQQPYPHPLAGGSAPMDHEPMRISGETCNWRRVDLSVTWGIVGVCVTSDGIQLAELTDFNDSARQNELEVASYFHRGAPDRALMSPSPEIFAPWIEALPDSAH
ncbi:MAG: hypothetical protein ABW199_00380, partial [Caulobacterales bacterium]